MLIADPVIIDLANTLILHEYRQQGIKDERETN